MFAREAGLVEDAARARFFLVEDEEPGPETRFSDEKLSLVLSVYRARDFDDAVRRVKAILRVCGIGHSVGIHTADPARARHLAEELDVVRVLVNQAHTFGNGGSFANGLNFTLSMGCGTWAGNSISENLNWRHFINVTHLVTEIPEDKPTEEGLFGAYWTKIRALVPRVGVQAAALSANGRSGMGRWTRAAKTPSPMLIHHTAS